jgi:hypothetical protein
VLRIQGALCSVQASCRVSVEPSVDLVCVT